MNKQKASKAKGKRGEKQVAQILVEAGFEAKPGHYPEPDVVSNFPYRIEVKDQSRLRLKEWIEQALDDGGKIVIFKQKRGTWYAAIPFQELIEIIKMYDREWNAHNKLVKEFKST